MNFTLRKTIPSPPLASPFLRSRLPRILALCLVLPPAWAQAALPFAATGFNRDLAVALLLMVAGGVGLAALLYGTWRWGVEEIWRYGDWIPMWAVQWGKVFLRLGLAGWFAGVVWFGGAVRLTALDTAAWTARQEAVREERAQAAHEQEMNRQLAREQEKEARRLQRTDTMLNLKVTLADRSGAEFAGTVIAEDATSIILTPKGGGPSLQIARKEIQDAFRDAPAQP